MENQAVTVLLQYGALGAIAVFAIFGVIWYGRSARQDMRAMLENSKHERDQFTSYLIAQAAREQKTNEAFVEAIQALSSRIDVWLGKRIG